MQKYSDEELLTLLRNFYHQHGITPKSKDFSNHNTFEERFGTWSKAISASGLPKRKRCAKTKFIPEDVQCPCGKIFQTTRKRCRNHAQKYCSNSCKSANHRGVLVHNGITKARERGEEFIISDETRQKLCNGNINRYKDPEARSKHSAIMLETVKRNPQSYSSNNVNGRVKKIDYNGIILTGNWEVVVAKLLDACGIDWKLCDVSFPYQWNSTDHRYFPDFYLPEFDLYIEVKGFQHQPDRDYSKWRSVNGRLIVLMGKDISPLLKFFQIH